MEKESALTGKILVVDDEEPIAKTLAQLLEKLGYQSCVAGNFDDVQTHMKSESFDLVTLDIVMPGTDGLKILEWLRQSYPDVGVVMATALGDVETVIRAIRLGASDYLVKPFTMELVGEEIRLALERQALIVENRAYRENLEQRVEAQTGELKQLNEQLQQQVKELKGRDRLVQFQLSHHTLKEAQEEIVSVIVETLAVERVVLFQVVKGEKQLAPTAYTELGGVSALGEPGQSEAAIPDWVGTATQAAVQALQERGVANVGGEMAVALGHQGETLGVLWVDGVEVTDGRSGIRRALAGLAQQAALILWKVQVLMSLEQGSVDVERLIGTR